VLEDINQANQLQYKVNHNITYLYLIYKVQDYVVNGFSGKELLSHEAMRMTYKTINFKLLIIY